MPIFDILKEQILADEFTRGINAFFTLATLTRRGQNSMHRKRTSGARKDFEIANHREQLNKKNFIGSTKMLDFYIVIAAVPPLFRNNLISVSAFGWHF